MASKKDTRLKGINPLSYVGVNAYSPPNIAEYDRPPTAADRRNLDIGSIWIDTSPVAPANPDVWMVVRFSGDTATWIKLAEGESSAEQFVTDAGTAIPALGILTVAGGNNISTQAAGSTVTIDLDGNVADTFQTDIAFAQPVAGTLEIAGGTYIETTGAGNVVTVDITPDIATLFLGDVGSAVPIGNTIYLAGGANVTTNAAAAVVTITATGGGGGGSANASFLAHQVADGGDPNDTFPGVKLGAAVVMTEVYDIGGNFTVGDGAGVAAKFTAPQDGKYLLQCSISFKRVAGSGNAALDRYIEIQTSNRTYRKYIDWNISTGSITLEDGALSFDVIADMDAADTVEYYAYNVDIVGNMTIEGDVAGTGEYQTFVSGTLEENDVFGFTEHAVLVGDATSGIGELALATDGQVLVGATGAASAWANITAGANITINEGANSLEIVSTGGGLGSSVASFLAFQNADDASGGASPVSLGETEILTEVFDIGADFYPGDGVGTPASFTAPQTGKYHLTMVIYYAGGNGWLKTSNRIYSGQTIIGPVGSSLLYSIVNVVADMDIGDTAEFTYRWSIAKSRGVINAPGDPEDGAYQTYVSGTLV